MDRYYDVVYIIVNIFTLILFHIFSIAPLIVVIYLFIEVRRNKVKEKEDRDDEHRKN